MYKLTLNKLKEMKPGEIFARGEIDNSPEGLYMNDDGGRLAWIAKRGDGYHDWAIYCAFVGANDTYIKQRGDKVGGENNIRKLVPCTNEAYELYRH